jgi:nucleoid DNA-binding protein
MTKPELIRVVAEGANITQVLAKEVIESAMDLIKTAIVQEGRVNYHGLGVFKLVTRKACLRPNPQKPGEKVEVPAFNTVKFRPSAALKEAVNK